MLESIVVKIGGSVLTGTPAYKDVAEQISLLSADFDGRIYVVVSAQKGKTDELISQVAKPGDETPLRQALEGKIQFLPYDNHDVAGYLLQGEIASTHRLASYLPGAKILDQMGHYPIMANSSYLNAIILMDECLKRKDLLNGSEKIAIVSGFGATDHHDKPVLLGRNASDLVAATVAKLAGSRQVIYLKDVDGIYENHGTPQQRLVQEMSFAQAAASGKVLDPRSLDMLAGCKTDIVVGHYSQLPQLFHSVPGYGTRIKQ